MELQAANWQLPAQVLSDVSMCVRDPGRHVLLPWGSLLGLTLHWFFSMLKYTLSASIGGCFTSVVSGRHVMYARTPLFSAVGTNVKDVSPEMGKGCGDCDAASAQFSQLC